MRRALPGKGPRSRANEKPGVVRALAAGEGMPERITLYKRAHEESAESMEDLVDEVRRTILHEVGHHFGMDEDDLPF